MKPKDNTPQLSGKDIDNSTIEMLFEIIRNQSELIGQLKDEINRLKKHPRKPNIKPSRLEGKSKDKPKRPKKKKGGSRKRKKTAELTIHEDKPIEPEHIPEGSRFIGYQDFVVQGIKIEPYNICYKLKVYETPEGGYVRGKIPSDLNNKHFSPELVAYILYQHYHCCVTHPLLLEQLREYGIDISSGQLNNILIKDKDTFHQEKDSILATGLEVCSYINVDDTGARHKGKNGYCTHIGNEVFSWFESTDSKSRINFLTLLTAGRREYHINSEALSYMLANRLPACVLPIVTDNMGRIFKTEDDWNGFLENFPKKYHKRIVTEGALVGCIVENGICKDTVIVSDDAGQFNVFIHALCWVHAERLIQKVIPITDQAKIDMESIRDRLWKLYNGLKNYKEHPSPAKKKRLEATFDKIFTTKTDSATLNLALQRIYQNKEELLLVLRRPEIPLHNNRAENGIREYVKKRKISGGTRADEGRKARDSFTSLKQTCRKLGISFWDYLLDRLKGTNNIPDLSELVRVKAMTPN